MALSKDINAPTSERSEQRDSSSVNSRSAGNSSAGSHSAGNSSAGKRNKDDMRGDNKPTVREVLRKKDVEAGKETKLEKGDFPALLIAAMSVMWPILLVGIGIMALVIYLFTVVFH